MTMDRAVFLQFAVVLITVLAVPVAFADAGGVPNGNACTGQAIKAWHNSPHLAPNYGFAVSKDAHRTDYGILGNNRAATVGQHGLACGGFG